MEKRMRKVARKKYLLPATAIALACATGAVFLTARDDPPKSLSLPANMCWGLVKGKDLQVLMGPGRAVKRSVGQNAALKGDYSETYCEYLTVSDKKSYRVLDFSVHWSSPDEERPLAASAFTRAKPASLHGNKNVYFLGREHRLFIPCVPKAKDAPPQVKRDGYLRIALSVTPMDNSGATAREAREAGLKTLLHIGREMEKRADCSGDQSRVPKLTPGFATNWPSF